MGSIWVIRQPARSILLALGLVAFGMLSSGCGSVRARDRVRETSLPLRFVCCYRDRIEPEALRGFDLAILDPSVRASPRELSDGGRRIVLGYLSVGEIDEGDPAWPVHKGRSHVLEPNPDWPGSHRVDVRADAWRRHVFARAREIIARGFDGWLLDTACVAGWLESRDPNRFAGARAKLVALIRTLRAAYPQAVIALNQGLDLYPAVRPLVDLALAEGLFARYDPKSKRYEAVTAPDDAERERLERFVALRRSGLRVFTIEYAPREDRALVAFAIERARAHRFEPYVARRELLCIRRDVLEALP